MKTIIDNYVFKNMNTFYLLPSIRVSYDYFDPTYLDLMWLNYGVQIPLPFKVKR